MESSDAHSGVKNNKPDSNGVSTSLDVPSLSDRCAQGFKECLVKFNLDEIDNYPNTVYGLWSDSTLAYTNKAWFTFMQENSGEIVGDPSQFLGKKILKSFPDQLKPFYQELFSKALAQDPSESLAPVQHAYECSSPEYYRQYSMALYPLEQQQGVLVVNSLVVMQSHKETAQPIENIYRDGDGIIHQCAHCRKVRCTDDSQRWDLVPAWIKSIPPNASHDLCLPCFEYYYPKN